MKLMNNYKLGKPCLSKIYLSLLLIGCVCVCAHTYIHVNEEMKVSMEESMEARGMRSF